MKKLFLAAALFLPSLLFAQNSLSSFFSKYEGKEGFTSVKISPKMFELVASAELDDEDMQAIKDITGLNVLVLENEDEDNTERARQLTQEAYAALGIGYDELLSVKEEGTDLKILARSVGDGIVSDLVIVGYDDGEFVFVTITGKIDLKKLKELDGKIDIDGFDHLNEIDTDKK